MSKKPLVPKAEAGLEKFKMEVAHDMSIENKLKKQDLGNLPNSIVSKITNSGNIGGEMVKRMVEAAEKNMASENKKV